MIEIHSYLKVGDRFVPVEEFPGRLVNPDYIEGAIYLKIGDTVLLSTAEWDYIDQLWAYLVDGLCQLHDGKSCSTYFPDQPIAFSVNLFKRGLVECIVEYANVRRRAVVAQETFWTALKVAAMAFFEQMPVIEGAPDYALYLRKLRALP